MKPGPPGRYLTVVALVLLAQAVATPAPSAAQTAEATASPAPAQTGARLLPPAWAEFALAWTSISAYSAVLTVFEQKGVQTQSVAFDYNFRKPSNATVRVAAGPNAGVTLVWNGGGTMEAHRGSGFTALFKKTISLHDPLATTIRGSSIDQLSFGAILEHAKQTPGAVSQSRGPVIDGAPTDELRLIPTTSATNTGLTLEVIYLSQATHLPMRVLGYEGQTLVRNLAFADVKLER